MPMLYDEHWAESPPGPIASPEWVRTTMGVRVGEVGAGKIVAALPLYGYKWGRDQPGETIGFLDAQRYAAEAGILLQREPSSQTMRARRENQWELWVADERLLQSLVTDIERTGVKRFAFWRLGLEDPALWTGLLR
jgi:spore germination protein YaaH